MWHNNNKLNLKNNLQFFWFISLYLKLLTVHMPVFCYKNVDSTWDVRVRTFSDGKKIRIRCTKPVIWPIIVLWWCHGLEVSCCWLVFLGQKTIFCASRHFWTPFSSPKQGYLFLFFQKATTLFVHFSKNTQYLII